VAQRHAARPRDRPALRRQHHRRHRDRGAPGGLAALVRSVLAFGLGASTLGGFAIATTGAGLFGDHEKWHGGYIWVAAGAESVAIVTGLLALSRELRTAPAGQRHTATG
jgi:hypothetical protein